MRGIAQLGGATLRQSRGPRWGLARRKRVPKSDRRDRSGRRADRVRRAENEQRERPRGFRRRRGWPGGAGLVAWHERNEFDQLRRVEHAARREFGELWHLLVLGRGR